LLELIPQKVSLLGNSLKSTKVQRRAPGNDTPDLNACIAQPAESSPRTMARSKSRFLKVTDPKRRGIGRAPPKVEITSVALEGPREKTCEIKRTTINLDTVLSIGKEVTFKKGAAPGIRLPEANLHEGREK